MDVDCIVVADIFDIFSQISTEKLIAFGRADRKSIHLAVLYSKKANNPILKKWREEAQIKLKNIPNPIVWSYFGNSIVNPILADDKFRNEYYIIDRSASGNILESTIFPNFDKKDSELNYKEFYFNKFIQISQEAVKLVSCGVISLHNSWTPNQYKKIYDTDVFLRTNVSLAKFLNFILYSNEYSTQILKNSLVLTEAYLQDMLNQYNISYKKKYFGENLVFDFNINKNLWAFDIIYENKLDKLRLYIVLRNIDVNQILKLNFFSSLNFSKNKSLLLIECKKEKLAENIIKIIKIIEESIYSGLISTSTFNCQKKKLLENNLVEDDAFINILMLDQKDSKLYIKGEAFILGSNIKEYKDIQYILELKGMKKYEFALAKEHSPQLTKKYASNTNVFYNKCMVTSYDNNGIDISSVENGKYEIFLHINSKDISKRQKLRTNNISDLNLIENSFPTIHTIQISNFS